MNCFERISGLHWPPDDLVSAQNIAKGLHEIIIDSELLSDMRLMGSFMFAGHMKICLWLPATYLVPKVCVSHAACAPMIYAVV